jgi:carboxylesterase type B
MAIPEARKLFQRAIIQSGGGHTAATLEAAQNLAVRLLGECGLSVSSATGLRSIPGPFSSARSSG